MWQHSMASSTAAASEESYHAFKHKIDLKQKSGTSFPSWVPLFCYWVVRRVVGEFYSSDTLEKRVHIFSTGRNKNYTAKGPDLTARKNMTIQATHFPKWREYRRRHKLVDAPSPFTVSLEGHLIHNPYVGSMYHGGRKIKPKQEPEKHNPFHPYLLHSPRCIDSSTSTIKSYLWESSMMPFICQLHAIAERKLTCVNMCRQSLRTLPTIIYCARSETEYRYLR